MCSTGCNGDSLDDEPLDGNFSAEMYVDDMVSSEACVRGNEERLLVATKSAVSDHVRMLGRYQDNPVPIMSTAKLTNRICIRGPGVAPREKRKKIRYNLSAFFVTPPLPAPPGVVASTRLCCLSRVPPAVCPSLLSTTTAV